MQSSADSVFAQFQNQTGTQATSYVKEGLHDETIRELELLELLGKVVPEGDDLEKVLNESTQHIGFHHPTQFSFSLA